MKLNSDQSTIMIVDDEPENLNVLGETLRMQGWRVQAFPCGKMALASARESPPDLVLLDVRMPGMDGHEVCSRFKADEALRGIPILFISALSAADDIAAGFACGGGDYVAKPFREAEVLARVRTHLALRQAYVKLAAEHAQLRMLERHRDTLTALLVDDMRSSLETFRRQFATTNSKGTATAQADPSGGLQAARRGTRLLNQVISTGVCAKRSVSDLIPLHRLTLPVHEIFHAACELGIRHSASHRITTSIVPLCPSVCCDVDLTELIIASMLAHALKSAPNDSRIVLSAKPVPGGVRIWVHDEGPGMPAHELRDFEDFGVAALSSGNPPPSIDMSLFFCKLAATAQGSTMGVENNDSTGNHLWLTLPTAVSPSDARHAHRISSMMGA